MAKYIIYFLNLLIGFYQKLISPLLGPSCRFYPSCSEYAKVCIHKYSITEAFRKIIWRLMRCHPFNVGGLDQP